MEEIECDTCGSIGEHDCEVWTPSITLILCDDCFFNMED